MDILTLMTLAKTAATMLSGGKEALETVKVTIEKNKAAYSEGDLNELTKMLVVAHSDAQQAGAALDAALAQAQNR